MQVVVVGVKSHSSVEKGPGEVVNGILLVLNCLGHYFCIEVVMEEVVQVGLGEEGEGEGEGREGKGGRGREGEEGKERGTEGGGREKRESREEYQ